MDCPRIHNRNEEALEANVERLTAGRWYALAFEDFDGELHFGEVLRYDGDGCWSDESGQPVHRVHDPIMESLVDVHLVEAYQPVRMQ